MDAIVKGTATGLELLLNIVAMLLVHGRAGASRQCDPRHSSRRLRARLSRLQRVLGLIMAPVCWLMGIPWSEAVTAGSLMGIKTILNEFIAYLELAKLPADALVRALAADHALCAVRLRQFRVASAS